VCVCVCVCVYAGSQPRRADGDFAELLPWLVEQAQDWEAAATATCAGNAALTRVGGMPAGLLP
jgi:hypothetical protein